MPTPLCDNAYGFSVAEHNPFFIFPYLQKKVLKHFKPQDVRDLSRGDPGLGYTPPVASREFYGFLVLVDTQLNEMMSGFRIHNQTEEGAQVVEDKIRAAATKFFQPDKAAQYLETLDFVVKRIQDCAGVEGCRLSRLDVLKGIFRYSTLVGGTYHTPWGEPIVKAVVADAYRKLLKDDSLRSDHFVFTLGVNDAIGTLFKMLGAEGLGYLQAGDTVVASSPAYAPYFNEINKRGLKTVEVASDPDTGAVDFGPLEECTAPVKAYFLITPNNPSGTKYAEVDLRRLAEWAKRHDAIVITDEIYAQFHSDFQSIWSFARERTIRLCGRSKIKSSPGLRFGDVLIHDETNAYLTKLLKERLQSSDFKTEFVWMKAPGGTFASFQHTASVPGPSQILGMLHILLGEPEEQRYVENVNQNMDAFFSGIGLPREGKMYYGMFDLNQVPGCIKQAVPIDKKLNELCVQYGVILIPALKFFSEKAQSERDLSNFVRVSLPNLTLAEVRDAAERIRKYLTE